MCGKRKGLTKNIGEPLAETTHPPSVSGKRHNDVSSNDTLCPGLARALLQTNLNKVRGHSSLMMTKKEYHTVKKMGKR